jgi:hypothetical protein
MLLRKTIISQVYSNEKLQYLKFMHLFCDYPFAPDAADWGHS